MILLAVADAAPVAKTQLTAVVPVLANRIVVVVGVPVGMAVLDELDPVAVSEPEPPFH